MNFFKQEQRISPQPNQPNPMNQKKSHPQTQINQSPSLQPPNHSKPKSPPQSSPPIINRTHLINSRSKITLDFNDSTAVNYNLYEINTYPVVLTDDIVGRKGSSIRFKIVKIGWVLFFCNSLVCSYWVGAEKCDGKQFVFDEEWY